MITKDQILEIINSKLTEDNVFLVDLNVNTGNKILIELDTMQGISIEYCIEISKLIEHSFDREIEDFEIEVSSPGLGLPYKILHQYLKNIGNDIEVVFSNGLKTKGKLISANSDFFEIEIQKMVKPEGKKRKELHIETQPIKFEEVKSVKNIITF